MDDRKPQNSVKQLSFNEKIKQTNNNNNKKNLILKSEMWLPEEKWFGGSAKWVKGAKSLLVDDN